MIVPPIFPPSVTVRSIPARSFIRPSQVPAKEEFTEPVLEFCATANTATHNTIDIRLNFDFIMHLKKFISFGSSGMCRLIQSWPERVLRNSDSGPRLQVFHH